MRWSRFLLIILLLGALVPLSRYFSGPALSLAPTPDLPQAPEPEAPALPTTTTPDPAITRLLDQTIEGLSEERAPWIEAKFWQKMRLPDLCYEGEIHFQSAPGHRYRLDIQTHLSSAEGSFVMICDGADVWAGSRVGTDVWTVATRICLQEIQEMLAGPTISPRLRQEFLEGETFSGVLPLLRNLRRQLCWVRSEMLNTEIRLTGVWSEEQRKAMVPPGKPWPASLARQCRLSLDPRTGWPRRIEWWGPRTPGGKDGLLAEMEFREMTINRQLTEKQCAEVFHFDPGKTRVLDQTAKVRKELMARNRELLAVGKK